MNLLWAACRSKRTSRAETDATISRSGLRPCARAESAFTAMPAHSCAAAGVPASAASTAIIEPVRSRMGPCR